MNKGDKQSSHLTESTNDEQLTKLYRKLSDETPQTSTDRQILAAAERAVKMSGIPEKTRQHSFWHAFRIPVSLGAAALVTLTFIPLLNPLIDSGDQFIEGQANPVGGASELSRYESSNNNDSHLDPGPDKSNAVAWSKYIVALGKAGEIEKMKQELAAFSEEYPEFPIADLIKSNLEP